MSDKTLSLMYNLCDRDEDCERGREHEGTCGLAVRERGVVLRYIESEDER